MSGIPVYTSSPIRAPQTATPESQRQAPGPNDAGVTTASTTSTSAYPPARPGASVPEPTGAPAAGTAHSNEPLHATPTTKLDGPAPPQPGAVPVPPNRNASNLPPPPKAGETYRPPQPQPLPYPAQMTIPPPEQGFRAQPTTTSTTQSQPSSSYPVPLSAATSTHQSLEHPPGYHQDVYASELTNSQRLAVEAMNASDPVGSGNVDDDESIWNAAKKWAQTAGTKLSEAEQEVWRRINKE